MAIRDFHVRLFATAQGSGLFEALRRLSSLEDPHLLASDEVSSGWIIWNPEGKAVMETAKAC